MHAVIQPLHRRPSLLLIIHHRISWCGWAFNDSTVLLLHRSHHQLHSDACGTATVTFTDATTPGSCANNYTVTRTFSATDACGNTATASQAITVIDNTPPVLAGVVAFNDQLSCYAIVLITNCK
jgi:hypothetical protein